MSPSLVLKRSAEGWSQWTDDGWVEAFDPDGQPRDGAASQALCRPAIVGVGPRDCLFGLVEGLGRGTVDRQEASFALEEVLPLSAEDCTSDFAYGTHGMAGVAAINSRVIGVLSGLREIGGEVLSVTPWALLAWEQALCSQDEEASRTLWLLAEGPGLHVVESAEGFPTSWLYTPNQAKAIETQIRRFQAKSPDSQVLIIGQVDLPSGTNGLTPIEESLDELALQRAREISNGEARPLFELHRERLSVGHRILRLTHPMMAALATSCLLLAALTAWSVCRTLEHRRFAAQCADRQAEVFGTLFPGEPTPIGVTRRLRAVARGLSGQKDATKETKSAGLPLLLRWLNATPTDFPVRLLEVRLDSQRITAELQARSHSEAERLAEAYRAAGFATEPPRSQKLPERGVGLRIDSGLQTDG